MGRRAAQPRQAETDGDLDSRRIADDGCDLVDLLEIVCRKAPAAEFFERLGNLFAGLDRVVVVQARLRGERADVSDLMDRGDVEDADAGRRCGAQHDLVGVGLDGVGEFAGKSIDECLDPISQRLLRKAEDRVLRHQAVREVGCVFEDEVRQRSRRSESAFSFRQSLSAKLVHANRSSDVRLELTWRMKIASR